MGSEIAEGSCWTGRGAEGAGRGDSKQVEGVCMRRGGGKVDQESIRLDVGEQEGVG